jgi:aminoglycoside phosphotransferase (APT) family kinase protein
MARSRPPATPTSPDLAPRLLEVLGRRCGRGVTYAEEPTPLSGGFSNEIFRFRLADPPPGFEGTLVLRVTHHDDDTAREAVIEDGVARAGYPAPRVVLYGTRAEFGQPFIITPLLPGVPFDEALRPSTALRMFRGLMTRLANAMADLHDLPVDAIGRELHAVGWDADRLGSLGVLAEIRALATELGSADLDRALAWLTTNIPVFAPAVVCHGDFHVMNVLYDEGRIASVVDWEVAQIADPAHDVARSIMLLRFAPLPMSAAVRPVVQRVRGRQARQFLAAYRTRRPVPDPSLRWHEALNACRTITIAAVGARPGGPERLCRTAEVWQPAAPALATWFDELTGVPITLPV